MLQLGKRLKTLVYISVLVAIILERKCASKHYHTIAGPYRLDFKRVERCPPELAPKQDFGGTYSYADARTRRDQPPTFHLNVSSPLDLDDSILVRVAVSSWSNNGGWKENAYLLNLKSVCTSWKLFFSELRSKFLMKIYGEVVDCPLLAGIIRVHNLSLTNMIKSPPGFDQFLYGRWRVDTQLINTKGVVVTCSRMFVNTVPR